MNDARISFGISTWVSEGRLAGIPREELSKFRCFEQLYMSTRPVKTAEILACR